MPTDRKTFDPEAFRAAARVAAEASIDYWADYWTKCWPAHDSAPMTIRFTADPRVAG